MQVDTKRTSPEFITNLTIHPLLSAETRPLISRGCGFCWWNTKGMATFANMQLCFFECVFLLVYADPESHLWRGETSCDWKFDTCNLCIAGRLQSHLLALVPRVCIWDRLGRGRRRRHHGTRWLRNLLLPLCFLLVSQSINSS